MMPPINALVDIALMRQVIVDLGPWASAALDDPDVCDELKEIFGRVVELSVKYDPELRDNYVPTSDAQMRRWGDLEANEGS